MNYHNKKFKAVSNSDNGAISAGMIFHYKQSEHILTCEYYGGDILRGQLIGLVDKDGKIEMRYHHVNYKGELMSGVCKSVPEIMQNGKIRLIENWQWNYGDHSKGQSILEEL